MRHFTQSLFLLSVLFFMTSCLGIDQEIHGQNASGNDQPPSVNTSNNQSPGKDPIKLHEIMDKQLGMVSLIVPLPESWEEDPTNKYALTGPDDLKVHKAENKNFAYSYNPYAEPGMLQQMGEIRPPVSLDEYIQYDLLPQLHQQNLEWIRSYPIPQYTAWLWAYDQMLFKYGPQEKIIETRGIEMKNKKGIPHLVIVQQQITNDSYSILWNVTYTILKSNENSTDQ